MLLMRSAVAVRRRDDGAGAAIIPVSDCVRVWLATGVTDVRRGLNTLALQVQGKHPPKTAGYAARC